MSTRATIGIKQSNGTITCIYCWYDGYPKYTGHILAKYYDTPEKIETLMKGGHIGTIKPTPELCTHMSWHGDKTPNNRQAQIYQDIEHYKRRILQINFDYGYLFEDGKWKVFTYTERFSQA